jgi:short subunit dehydrogenase-like uncharacterized protein
MARRPRQGRPAGRLRAPRRYSAGGVVSGGTAPSSATRATSAQQSVPVDRHATIAGRSTGLPASIDHARRTNWACVQPSGLAHDDLPATAGQLTTAVAMGDALIERLQRLGISFAVLG